MQCEATVRVTRNVHHAKFSEARLARVVGCNPSLPICILFCQWRITESEQDCRNPLTSNHYVLYYTVAFKMISKLQYFVVIYLFSVLTWQSVVCKVWVTSGILGDNIMFCILNQHIKLKKMIDMVCSTSHDMKLLYNVSLYLVIYGIVWSLVPISWKSITMP